jgi:hypothetical protein
VASGGRGGQHVTPRHRDLLLTAVMLGLALTPAWFVPTWLSVPWQLVFFVVGPLALWHSWHHAPWQPTPRAELDRVLRALALRPESRFCDLGAGDGRLVARVHAATGAECTGLEVSPLLWLVASARLAASRRTRARLGDLYRADLSSYDAVYVWGTAYSVDTERFGAHVRTAMRPGARLVSYHHPVHGLVPDRVDEGGQRPLFVYTIPSPGAR